MLKFIMKEPSSWKIKEFTLGDKVLLFNSSMCLFGHGKFQSKCEEPLKVVTMSSHGAITMQSHEGNIFKVNMQHFSFHMPYFSFSSLGLYISIIYGLYHPILQESIHVCKGQLKPMLEGPCYLTWPSCTRAHVLVL